MEKKPNKFLLLYIETAAVAVALLGIFILKLFAEQSLYAEFSEIYKTYFEPDTSFEEFFNTQSETQELIIE